MKRLGDELGVTAMAIYRHFASKSEVIEGILDRFVREADVTGHGVDPSDWRGWTTQTALRQYRALAAAPGVIPFVATNSAWQFGAAAMTTMDASLGVLERAGFTKQAALEVQMNALAMVVGWATLGSSGGDAAANAAASGEYRREIAGVARSTSVFERGLAQYLSSLAPRAS